MKQQVSRLSPHQNGKVFAVLMAISSLIFLIPAILIMASTMPGGAGPTWMMLLLMPLMYLVLVYIMVSLSCLIYNAVFKFIGGIEFETEDSLG
jgi:membrane protein YdbS with pleckstrin-like domain